MNFPRGENATTLILDLPPELESQLQAAAQRSGQDINSFATAALAQASSVGSDQGELQRANVASRPSLVELDAALDELEAIGAGVPSQDESFTHSRDDIYFDHD